MSNNRFPHGNRKYPWDVWETGRHVAKKGVHFRGMTARDFQNQLHARASYIKRKVKTSVISTTEVEFEFIDREEAKASRESRKDQAAH